MYSDLERFYFQYQTEALPHGESPIILRKIKFDKAKLTGVGEVKGSYRLPVGRLRS